MRKIALHCMPRFYFDAPETSANASASSLNVSGNIQDDMIPAQLSPEKKAQKTWELLPEQDLRFPDDGSTMKTKAGRKQ